MSKKKNKFNIQKNEVDVFWRNEIRIIIKNINVPSNMAPTVKINRVINYFQFRFNKAAVKATVTGKF